MPSVISTEISGQGPWIHIVNISAQKLQAIDFYEHIRVSKLKMCGELSYPPDFKNLMRKGYIKCILMTFYIDYI